MNTLLLIESIDLRSIITLWIIFLVLLVLESIVEWRYFRRNRDFALKRKVLWWSALIRSLVVLPIVLLMFDLGFALVFAAFLGAIVYFGLRNMRICDRCGKVNRAPFLLWPAENCRKCEAALTEKVTA